MRANESGTRLKIPVSAVRFCPWPPSPLAHHDGIPGPASAQCGQDSDTAPNQRQITRRPRHTISRESGHEWGQIKAVYLAR